MRNAISHNDGKLHLATVRGLESGFGHGYFKLTTGDQFDFEDAQNLRRLAAEAENFLKDAHADLRNELTSKSI